MGQGNPLPGEQYRHFKNKRYQVITVAYHSETKERYVVYQALYGDFKTYIRPYEMFVSEVDHEKYPEVQQKYRFEYLGNVADDRATEDSCENEGEGIRFSTADDQTNKQHESEVQKEERRLEGKPHKSEESAETAKEDESHINPWLDQILDAQSFEEKYKIVCDMQSDITDRLIDDIAVVMDLAIPEGRLSDRYAQLKHCIRTRQRYESGRLR